MECTNEQIAALLSDYFSGHLSTAETDTVRAHLATCQVCRESLQAMSLLAPNGIAGGRSHPSKNALAQFYRDRSGLTSEIAALLEKHVAGCRECAAELAILDDMERELRGSVSGVVHSERWIQTFVHRYGRYAAYAAAACLLISVGYRILTTEDRDGGRIQIYQLTESTRAGSRPVEIRREAGISNVVFDVQFYHLRAENDYSAALVDAHGQQVAAEVDRLDFPQVRRIHVHMRLIGVPVGEYQLVIRESKRGSTAQPSQTYYPFELLTAD